MIPVIEGFSPETTEPIDSRILLTKEEMKSMDTSILPDPYFAVEKSTGSLYVYTSCNADDPITGKYKMYAKATE